MENLKTIKIVSGGQTGADRAGLDWAIKNGIEHGGWCPKGRRSEDGTIPSRYQLQETPSPDYLQRTEWNVRDSEGTAIFSLGEKLTGGWLKALQVVQEQEKPWIYLCATRNDDPPKQLWKFIRDNHIRVLNVAGPRASEEPEVGSFVTATLHRLFTPPLIYVVQKHNPKLLGSFLQKEIKPHCVVRAFSDPQQALQSFGSEERSPDVLITGLVLEGMGWMELFQACKRLKPSLKVIVFSSMVRADVAAWFENKPLKPDAWINKMDDLDRQALLAETQNFVRFRWPNDRP